MPKVPETFSKNLRRYRELRGLTQAELALKSGVHRNSIALYEKGSQFPTLEKVAPIAAALGVEETDLFYPGEPPKPVQLKPDLLSAFDMIAEARKNLKKGDPKAVQELISRLLKEEGES